MDRFTGFEQKMSQSFTRDDIGHVSLGVMGAEFTSALIVTQWVSVTEYVDSNTVLK